MERLYFNSYPKDPIYTIGKYDHYVDQFKKSGQDLYINIPDPNSSFYQKRFNYYSGNPCAYNPSLLASIGLNVSTCQTLVGNLPTQGLSAAIRWAANQSSQCQAGKMSLPQFATFSNILKVINTYQLDVLQAWGV